MLPCPYCFGPVLPNPPSIHTFILISNLPSFVSFPKIEMFSTGLQRSSNIFFVFLVCSKSCQGYHCASHGWASQVIHLMAEGTRRCKSTTGRTSGPGKDFWRGSGNLQMDELIYLLYIYLPIPEKINMSPEKRTMSKGK